MKLYQFRQGLVVEHRDEWRLLNGAAMNDIFVARNPVAFVKRKWIKAKPFKRGSSRILAPTGDQEVWAAGVTYLRSRSARKEESKDNGGGTFYDKVYVADRPELFFKAAAWRLVPSGGTVRIRPDSKWNVPEPELTLAVSASGRIFGYTLGNDMSSRSIEGENPLYLPQAKVYDGAASIGPCVVITDDLPSPEMEIQITVTRKGRVAFEGVTQLKQIKRKFTDLVNWLYRDLSFPQGAYLMTGTGLVPPSEFTLARADKISIASPGIGELVNIVG